MKNHCLHEQPEHGKIFVVNWLLGTICNYRCRYCTETLYAGQEEWVSIEKCEGMVDTVAAQCERLGKTPYFEFTGGEVTIYKHLPRLLAYIQGNGGKTGIITNGSAHPTLMDQVLGHLNHICISFHPRYANHEKFLDNVKRSAARTTTHVNVMADPLFLDRVEAIFEALLLVEGITISVQPLQENLGGGGIMMKYTDEQRASIESMETRAPMPNREEAFIYRGRMEVLEPAGVYTAPQITNGKLNRWKGWECSTGTESFVIDERGDVYNGWCKQEFYGSVLDGDDIRSPSVPIVCRKQRCLCNIDILCSKQLDSEAVPLEHDYKGRSLESLQNDSKTWTFDSLLADGELVVEFKIGSRQLFEQTVSNPERCELTVHFREGGEPKSCVVKAPLVHLNAISIRLGEPTGEVRQILSLTVSGCSQAMVYCLKLNRVTVRSTSLRDVAQIEEIEVALAS